MNDYTKCIDYWNQIFSEEGTAVPKEPTCGIPELDEGIRWLCEHTQSILDFGCGNGLLLFFCARNGTKFHTGIDLSEAAIRNARARAEAMPIGTFQFLHGSIDTLANIPEASMDAVILSNILDNLYPEDAARLITQVHRVLKSNGKLLVKLNPYLTQKQIADWGIKHITDCLLDDGLLLLNRTNSQWRTFFESSFQIVTEREILYPEAQQTDRLFCMAKK